MSFANMESESSTSEEYSEDTSSEEYSEDDNKIEERHFRQLYHTLLDDYLKRHNISDEKVREAISSIINSFKYDEGGNFSNIDFDDVEMICGYLFRYAPHGAGLARCRTREAVKRCIQLKSILKKKNLKVVSLGGGPGNDAIGFCSAVSTFDFAGKLNMHVVDTFSKWSGVVSNTKMILKQGDFGKTSEIFKSRKALLNFIRCSLPEGLNDLPLKNCHIVLICKLISIMKWKDKEDLVQNLHRIMNKFALILLIDCPFDEELWCDRFEILYLSQKDQRYCSSTVMKWRFGHNDRVTSNARIAVLRKK